MRMKRPQKNARDKEKYLKETKEKIIQEDFPCSCPDSQLLTSVMKIQKGDEKNTKETI